MKRNNTFFKMAGMLLLLAGITLTACSVGDDGADDGSFRGPYDFATAEGEAGAGGGNSMAGIVTAGEWNDLQHWPFWSQLMLGSEYADKSDYWQFYTNNRIAVQVSDKSGRLLAGIPVKLMRGNATVWQTKTDNHGMANCWMGLFQKEQANARILQLSIDGQLMDSQPVVCQWDSISQAVAVNRFMIDTPSTTVLAQADIAFVVDATGSMGDEINFLKSDLVDIINKAQTVNPEITMRTAALFYRDEGDEYLTRHSGFTTQLDETAKFVSEQKADGGNDYPEAVHTALERMLQDLAWEPQARTRMAFMLLDAPAHHETDVIRSLQQSIESCAKQGIRLIPVAASGVDKNTEFMLRFFAIATGGTYVFLTNDSGVGNDHIAATVGDYEVENLNNLIIRLIGYYIF